MDSPEATIYCPNTLCQAPNVERDRYCLQCGTFLPKHYLWAIAQRSRLYSPNEMLSDRYLCKQGQTFIDTKPGLLPESLEELPPNWVGYQRLVSHWLHVPQIYALLPDPQLPSSAIALLENAPIYGADIHAGTGHAGTLMPGLKSVWREASALQQLHWLWQMAQLWEPLNQEGVAASVLSAENLHVEGSLVRLLSLVGDYQPLSGSLIDLGLCWQQWQPTAQSAIAPFFNSICNQLRQGQIDSSELLIRALDRAIAVCSQAQSRVLEFATLTDQGPTRQRNEDACYPASGTTQSVMLTPADQTNPTALVVVCDGIGGHEGGNIASNLAIAIVQQRLQTALQSPTSRDPHALTLELKRTAIAANDTIVQRNDTEHRQDRQRMGTTLVMAVGQSHELYLTHVGDSRAYRITRIGCHQVTLDDDLASREVRMGYGLYRDALRQPSAGSLVQALGMNASMLHPTVQRFILDEECLFLLCSDGLSDNDLIEEYWQTVLVPVLEGTLEISTAVRQLVAIANQQNGHDNVTIGLLHCRVNPASSADVAELQLAESLATVAVMPVEIAPQISATADLAHPTQSFAANPSTLKTQLKSQPRMDKSAIARSRPRLLLGLLSFLTLLGVIGLMLVWLFPNLGIRLFPAIESTAVPESPAPKASGLASPSPAVAPSSFLTIQSQVLVNRAAVDGTGQTPMLLQSPLPGIQSNPPLSRMITIPVGTVLEVVAVQVQLERRWLELKVCSLPTAVKATERLSTDRLSTDRLSTIGQPGDTGWIQDAAIAPLVTSDITPTSAQRGACGAKRQTVAPSIETN